MVGERRAPMVLLACEPALGFANGVAAQLGVSLTPSRDVWFACGEGKHIIEANVRGADVYVFQQAVAPGGGRSAYERLVMALHAVDAARCADADRVTLVLPYLPGSRQDKRKHHVREGVSTGLFARMLTAAGVGMVLTVEPHNEATIGCYDPSRTVFEGLSIVQPFSRYLKQEGLARQTTGSTDVGGLEMARAFAKFLLSDLVGLSKQRDYSQAGVVSETTVLGRVNGRGVLIVDDIVDTAGSAASAIRALWALGATDITLAAAHMLLSGGAWDLLDGLAEEAAQRGVAFDIVGTSSVIHRQTRPYFRQMALEPLVAEAIQRVNRRGSLRALE